MQTKSTTIQLLILSILSFLPMSVFSQSYGNEWVDYAKTYYKIATTENRLYRLTYDELKAQEFPVGRQVHPERFQIYHNGVEIPIFVAGQDDGSFDPEDYIEFYGAKLDGTFDHPMYKSISDQPTDKESLYDNKAYFFLSFTLGFNEKGLRTSLSDVTAIDSEPAPFHIELLSYQDITDIGRGPLYPTSILSRDYKGGILSDYRAGSGYLSKEINPAWGTYKIEFAIKDPVQTEAYTPSLETTFHGRINTKHLVNVYLGTLSSPGLPVRSLYFDRYAIERAKITIDSTISFPTSTGTFYMHYDAEVQDPTSWPEWYSFCKANLYFPQKTKMGEEDHKVFRLPPSRNNTQIVAIENASADSRIFDISDRNTFLELKTSFVDGKLQCVVPNANLGRTLMVMKGYASVVSFKKSAIAKQNYLTPNYFIISHKDLMKKYEEYANPVQAYAEYRASSKGGGYQSIVVDVENIFDTFGYGVYSPIALRNFSKYIHDNGRPEYIFLLGKALNHYYLYYKTLPNSANNPIHDLVPTFGLPGSDNLYTSGLGNSTYEPEIPIGRLPAYKPEHVVHYLNKVKEHESMGLYDPWRKNILHLSGGKSQTENALFKSYMADFESIAEGDFLGANVSTIAKKTTDFVEFVNVADYVNQGSMLITFYGHANIDYTDIEIGYINDPRFNYQNKGKYPMIIVNGCGSGDIFSRLNSFAEDWLFAKDRGAVLFLAHSYIGFTGPLRSYTQTFYETAFADKNLINKPIGFVLKNSIRRYTDRSNNYELAIANAQQFILAGDPAVKLVFADKVDYAISSESLQLETFDPSQTLNSKSDSFKILVNVKNLGIIDEARKAISLQVRRTFADGSKKTYPISYHTAIKTESTLSLTMVTTEEEQSKASGLNRFECWIDVFDSIPEISERNNYALMEYVFDKGNLINLSPKEFSIVQEKNITLIAQNTDVLTSRRFYDFEIDTSFHFNSSLKKSLKINDFATPSWNIDLPMVQDSTVFYWRARYAQPEVGEDTTWALSSFVYIPNSPDGWSQSHYFQFEKDKLSGLDRIDGNRTWAFKPFSNSIYVEAIGASAPNWGEYLMVLNEDTIVKHNCSAQGLVLVTFDHNTGEIYNPMPGHGCGNSVAAVYLHPSELSAPNLYLNEYLENVAEGDYVILFNTRNAAFPTIFANPSAQTGLKELGIDPATALPKMALNLPFIFMGRKGAPLGSAIEVGTDPTSSVPGNKQVIHLQTTVSGIATKGSVTSTLIGPAEEWTRLHRAYRGAENPSTESIDIDVYGVDFSGNETLLIEQVPNDSYDLRSINSRVYPYIKLQATMEDTTYTTPYQLDRWQVIYKEVPEGILFFDTLTYRKNTVLEVVVGDSVNLGYRFVNISGNDFVNPLIVSYTLKNLSSNATTVFYDTLSSLQSGQTLKFNKKIYSLDFVGENSLTAYINPKIVGEQFYENNILEAKFKVKPDDVNPVLDVAFDGRHILDGDIVSPTPLISIGLKDDNTFLLRQDTIGINMYLTACDTCSTERISFAGSGMSWTANPDNNFKIQYQPESPLPDGEYTLTIDAHDVSGNASGAEPFRQRFKVINESTLSNFYPYPNPCTSSMRFVFTITGNEIPENILIRIMTVRGEVVREITKEELGTLRIGNNISEFSWDGTDQFGDRLANGVYLYKVYIKSNGSDFKHLETAGDKLFKHDIGKIYLMK